MDIPLSQSSTEATRFFQQSLKKGGVIVSVELTDNQYRNRAESILQTQRAVAVAAVS